MNPCWNWVVTASQHPLHRPHVPVTVNRQFCCWQPTSSITRYKTGINHNMERHSKGTVTKSLTKECFCYICSFYHCSLMALKNTSGSTKTVKPKGQYLSGSYQSLSHSYLVRWLSPDKACKWPPDICSCFHHVQGNPRKYGLPWLHKRVIGQLEIATEGECAKRLLHPAMANQMHMGSPHGKHGGNNPRLMLCPSSQLPET